MKKIIGTVIGYYLICFILAVIIYSFLFPYGGVVETHLYPIYFGLIVLSAIIVICTCIVLEEIKNLKQEVMKVKDDRKEEKSDDISEA
ncbi:MAG: hypothetical protein VB047_00135 [Anaerotignum propionicum]|uniref:hypothetical protein n=1 Tax=Anaerotignum propionicum TaxID=28446 RepID=UPI002B1FC665|nr:hypothetical protein [Anaerotignum propionicum]MEA5055954.1 hypothetical protein [Anaerotignum propionicum]